MIILNYLKEITVIYFLVYIYNVAEDIKRVSGEVSLWLLLVIGITIVICLFYCSNCERGPEKTKVVKRFTKIIITLMVTSIMMGSCSVLLPNQEGIKLLAAVYVGDTIVSNPDVQRIGGKSVDLLEKFIDDTSKKLDPPVLPKKP